MFPFTMVPFWVPIFDPQPFGRIARFKACLDSPAFKSGDGHDLFLGTDQPLLKGQEETPGGSWSAPSQAARV